MLVHSVSRSFRGEKELGNVNYQRNNTSEIPRGNKYKYPDHKFPLTIQYTELKKKNRPVTHYLKFCTPNLNKTNEKIQVIYPK